MCLLACDNCFPTILAVSDHKGVVVAFETPSASMEGVDSKLYCPESFLQAPDTVEGLEAGLQKLSGDGPEWWAAALGVVKKVALKFHKVDSGFCTICADHYVENFTAN